jgi:hypothetical protein
MLSGLRVPQSRAQKTGAAMRRHPATYKKYKSRTPQDGHTARAAYFGKIAGRSIAAANEAAGSAGLYAERRLSGP